MSDLLRVSYLDSSLFGPLLNWASEVDASVYGVVVELFSLDTIGPGLKSGVDPIEHIKYQNCALQEFKVDCVRYYIEGDNTL